MVETATQQIHRDTKALREKAKRAGGTDPRIRAATAGVWTGLIVAFAWLSITCWRMGRVSPTVSSSEALPA